MKLTFSFFSSCILFSVNYGQVFGVHFSVVFSLFWELKYTFQFLLSLLTLFLISHLVVLTFFVQSNSLMFDFMTSGLYIIIKGLPHSQATKFFF